MLKLETPRHTALFLLASAIVIIGSVWIFEYAGYAPCPLCLKQRWPWYALIPFAALIAVIAPAKDELARGLLYLAALVLAGSAVFGIYHSGVEWKWWPGPGTCAGELGGGLPDLTNEPVISCEEAAIRILGLSLAGWNAVVSAILAIAALLGARRRA